MQSGFFVVFPDMRSICKAIKKTEDLYGRYQNARSINYTINYKYSLFYIYCFACLSLYLSFSLPLPLSLSLSLALVRLNSKKQYIYIFLKILSWIFFSAKIKNGDCMTAKTFLSN
jgi:hypothetical protein